MIQLSNMEIRDKITTLLSIYEVYLQNENNTNRTNFNIECENIFRDLLNKLYNWNLVNLNVFEYSYPAIDLGDINQGVCVQVTSQNSSTKINETINRYKEKGFEKIYSRIYILILGQKKKYRISIPDHMNIIDFRDIISYISFINDSTTLLQLLEIINNKFIQYNIPGASTSFFTSPTPILKLAKDYGCYKQYLSDLKLNEEEIESTISDVIILANQLLRLHINTRRLILFGIQYRIYNSEYYHDWKSYIHFNCNSMQLHIDNTILNYSISELNSLNHIFGLDDEEGVCHFYFPDEGRNYCILNEVCNFCEKTRRNIEQLLINLDLTIFD